MINCVTHYRKLLDFLPRFCHWILHYHDNTVKSSFRLTFFHTFLSSQMKLLSRAVCNNHQTNKILSNSPPQFGQGILKMPQSARKWCIDICPCLHGRLLPQLKTWLFPVLFSKIMIWSLIFYHNFDHWSWFDLYDCGAHIYDYSNSFINWKKKNMQQIYHNYSKKPHIMNTHSCLSMWIWKHIKATMCGSLLLPWPSDMNVC